MEALPCGGPRGEPSYWYPAHATMRRLTPQLIPETPVSVRSQEYRDRVLVEKLGLTPITPESYK
jgi:hypothetical protein